MKTYDRITDLIGKTPLLKLNNYSKLKELGATVYGKLEYFNPAGSVKDRIAKAMIDDAEAKRRRDKIQEEANFFGSMDGAVKYVKGDAVAGLIITFVNLIGGIMMGVMRQGLEMSAALNTYSVLTIGDGLVSAIPSLLISLSTGILVTKGSKDADFGEVMIGQLFGVPKVL